MINPGMVVDGLTPREVTGPGTKYMFVKVSNLNIKVNMANTKSFNDIH